MNNIMDLKTPCFIINEYKLQNNISEFIKALSNIFYNGIVGYSVKTNSLPFILKKALDFGCYAEVVSADEFFLAKKIGFPVSKIIYNGPMKSKETFIEAVENGAIVNIENFCEIEWLKDVNDQCNYNLGVRVNINFHLIGVDEEPHSYSRFGFSYENGDVARAINTITKYGFTVKGIHAHRTSTTRKTYIYNKIAQYVSTIIKDLKLDLKYIDFGGGYFGDMPGKPSYYDYVNEIKQNLSFNTDKLIVIVEPGNGIIASPVDYVFSILDTKEIQGKVICSSDATRLDVDPFFHKEIYNHELLVDEKLQTIEKCQLITGATCLENDILFELYNERKLYVGDKIILKCVGAYTMALTPNFINYLPIVYTTNDGCNFKVVRDKWQPDIIMMNSKLEDCYE